MAENRGGGSDSVRPDGKELNVAGQYRTELISEVPKRWKVRTVAKGTHLVRLAFPPGKRKKGSGKLIEILHPVNENPCAMAQERGPRPVSRENPGPIETAADQYAEFHGKDAKEVMLRQESDVIRKVYSVIDPLGRLIIDAPSGKVEMDFTGDGVIVARAPSGTQIYLIGGNQNIDARLEVFGTDLTKDFIELGRVVQIEYDGRKAIDGFKLTRYHHRLGEETKEPPLAFYNRLQRRIFFVGGRYRMDERGIIN